MIVAARNNSKFRMAGLAGVLTGVLLAGGCTSGGGSGTDGQAPGSSAAPAAPAQPLKVELVTMARVPPGGPSPKSAATQAEPGL